MAADMSCEFRSIPACAGETLHPLSRRCRRQVDPRVRGGDASIVVS